MNYITSLLPRNAENWNIRVGNQTKIFMRKLLMASAIFTFFAASLTLFQIASCKKADAQITETDCPPNTYPITGLWEGTYQTNQVSHAPTYASFTIYPDGSFLRRAKHSGTTEYAFSKGRWKLTGNTFEYRDTTILYTGGLVVGAGTATFNNSGTLTNATWQDVSGQPYTGTYQNIKRIN